MGFLLHQLLADAAAVSPDREAVRCLGRSLTYGELDAAANAVARALIAGGVQPADRVAILLPKRVETIACVYGILKAGAAYVPLDPKGPARRAALVGAEAHPTGAGQSSGSYPRFGASHFSAVRRSQPLRRA